MTGKIHLQGLTGEETVETLSKVDVCFAIEKDPVGRTEDLGGDIDHGRLEKGGGIEDFSGEFTVGCNDHEPGHELEESEEKRGGGNALVKDGDTAQVATFPLLLVFEEVGSH